MQYGSVLPIAPVGGSTERKVYDMDCAHGTAQLGIVGHDVHPQMPSDRVLTASRPISDVLVLLEGCIR